MAVVSKSEFAKLCTVSKGNVTHWLKAGRIDGPAVVGEGRTAKIDVELAMAQLKERLSVNERFGLNGLNTNLEPPAPARTGSRPPAPARGAPPPDSDESGSTIEARLKAQKLRQAELLTDQKEMEDRARHGLYIEANAAAAEMHRIASEMMKIFEGALTDFATGIAGQFQLSQRDVKYRLQTDFQVIAGQLEAVYLASAAKEPETVEVA